MRRGLQGRERQRALRELRVALGHQEWDRIRRLHVRLDEVPLLDELAVVVASRENGSVLYSGQASDWLVRLFIERRVGGLYRLGRFASLLWRPDAAGARMELAGMLAVHARLDARPVLGITVPPSATPHESFPDYLARLRELGKLDAFVDYERTQKAALAERRI